MELPFATLRAVPVLPFLTPISSLALLPIYATGLPGATSENVLLIPRISVSPIRIAAVA